MKSKLSIISLLLLFAGVAQGQGITQTIRGRVVDVQSQSPLPGVNVYTLGENRLGTTTDMDGYYELTNVPIGRVSLGFSFMGYEAQVMSNLELTGSKELVLNLQLRESTEYLQEVEVVAGQPRERVQNEMVNVSGRTFSVEETGRYAGSFQDVSRMASNFAGVQRTDDATNDIVIRGNSPNGLIWRLEGVDIPNPNHFGGLGATGGPVSMLNNNVLANSDFLTGAFPSNYGDGLSGVFDLKLRNGNYEKHEFLGQIGFNGLEFGAEGPLSRESNSSYLANYRYSTLGIMSAMGVNFGTGTAIPYYQDLSMKLHFPSTTRGTFDVFALGGISSIEFLDSENEEGEDGGFYSDDQDLRNKVKTGVLGASHQYFFNRNTYSKITAAVSTIRNYTDVDTINLTGDVITPVYRQEFVQNNLQLAAYLNHKLSARHVIRAGAFVTVENFNLVDSTWDVDIDRFRTLRDHKATDVLYQPYANWQYRPDDQWELNMGLHSMIMQSNGNASLEPRFGASFNINERQSLNFGYGLHSQRVHPSIQYEQLQMADGSYVKLNEDLPFVKSQHLVLGYQHLLKNRIQFKAEAYYQYVYNAVVERKTSPFSSLNAGSFNFTAPDSVKSGGIGYNYGLDLTLEKFMDKGFYFLSSLSLYESQYQGSDQVWRNTAFNGNYVLNALGGKEFVMGKSRADKKNRSKLSLDGKLTFAGGQRYTPLDLEQTKATGDEHYDLTRAYGEQFDPYFRADIRIGYTITGKKVTQEWAFDIQNITNHQNPFGQEYDSQKQKVVTTYQLGLFPMMLYRITF